ncbi:MAG TPA: hypothetical protein V6D02_04295 [Candidatus Obscuribacterales bacterium]
MREEGDRSRRGDRLPYDLGQPLGYALRQRWLSFEGLRSVKISLTEPSFGDGF